MLVRDADGEATHLSQWSGLARKSPLVAAVMTILLLSMAGIPLTSGFTGKFFVFRAAWDTAGPLVVIALLCSAIAAFFYLRIVVLMFFAEPPENAPTIAIPGWSATDRAHLRRRRHRACSASSRSRSSTWRARPRSSGDDHSERAHAMSRADRLRRRVRRPELEASVRRGLDAVEAALAVAVRSDDEFVARRGPATSSTPAASGSGRCCACSPRTSAIRPGRDRPGGRGRRAHPPRDAVPRRRHGRGARAARRRVGQLAVGQHGRDPDRRLPVLTRVEPAGRPRPARRPAAGADVRAAGDRPDPRDGRARRRRRPDRALPGGARRQDRLADRDVGRVRRVLRRRRRRRHRAAAQFGEQIGVAFQLSRRHPRHRVRRRPSRARRRAPTCARASPTLPVLYALRADGPGRRAAADAGVAAADRRRRARRGAGAAARPPTRWPQARATATTYADRARAILADLPDVPARAALAALCDLVVARTG